MGDDVPILGALVTLLEAMGNCCFWSCFYLSVWSDHHISSLYLVWEMTSQFSGLWSRFWRQWVTVVFDDVSIHQYGQIIIYHHCIWFWYGRWRPNFGCSGDTFWGWLVHWMVYFVHLVHVVIWSSGNPFSMVIWSSCQLVHLVNMVVWSSGHLVIWSFGNLVIWSSGHLVIWLIWSSGHYSHLVIWSLWSSGHLFFWSI